MKGLRRYSNPCTKMFPLKIFRGLRCKPLTECDLASDEEAEKMRLSDKGVSVSVRSLYPTRYRHGGNAVDEHYGEPELESD